MIDALNAPINHSEIYCFARISLITPRIPFGPVAAYEIYLPLSTSALRSIVRWLSTLSYLQFIAFFGTLVHLLSKCMARPILSSDCL